MNVNSNIDIQTYDAITQYDMAQAGIIDYNLQCNNMIQYLDSRI